MVERRRTERIFLRIPVAVRGIDQAGRPFAEKTTTVEVNRDGARIGLKSTPRLGGEVQITNLTTNFTALFRTTVRCPQSYDGLTEWGMGLSASMPDLMSEFWGIAFEEWKEEAPPHISGLLACRNCGRRELVSISRDEYNVLRSKSSLPRVCANCRGVSEWEVGGPARRKPADPAATESREKPAEGADEAFAERRKARRLALKVPVLVKAPSGASEEAETRELSKTGVSFATSLELAAGDRIELVVGHGATASAATQMAEVVWRRPEEKGVRALVGARFATAGPSAGEDPPRKTSGRAKSPAKDGS